MRRGGWPHCSGSRCNPYDERNMSGTVLIVDDEPANLALLRQVLAPEYPLVFARSGAEALMAAAKHAPALILLDIRMPDMDGYAVCRQLKNDPATAHIPVIFVTGLADVGDETAGFEAGAVDYIVKPISPPIVRARVRTHLSLVSATQLRNSYRDAIHMLGEASEFKDTDTGVHIWRMANYSAALAAASGWNEDDCQRLKLAAPMHDIGKLGIPDAILHKPGELTGPEWEVMRQHPVYAYNMLAPITYLRHALDVSYCHHEKWDGSGYPRRLKGEEIPLTARVFAVVDVFDALTSDRPYRKAWPKEKVYEYIEEQAGKQFDPQVVKVFLESINTP